MYLSLFFAFVCSLFPVRFIHFDEFAMEMYFAFNESALICVFLQLLNCNSVNANQSSDENTTNRTYVNIGRRFRSQRHLQ